MAAVNKQVEMLKHYTILLHVLLVAFCGQLLGKEMAGKRFICFSCGSSVYMFHYSHFATKQ